MPWIYNTREYPVSTRTADGKMRVLPGKERFLVKAEQMSHIIQGQLDNGIFVNQGDDPSESPLPVEVKQETQPDTSSELQSPDANIHFRIGGTIEDNKEMVADSSDIPETPEFNGLGGAIGTVAEEKPQAGRRRRRS